MPGDQLPDMNEYARLGAKEVSAFEGKHSDPDCYVHGSAQKGVEKGYRYEEDGLCVRAGSYGGITDRMR